MSLISIIKSKSVADEKMNYFLPSELLIPRMAGIGPMTANTLGVPASWLTNVWRLKFGINVGLGCVELRLNH